MAGVQFILPDEFRQSYSNWYSYPNNIVAWRSYGPAGLMRFRERLKARRNTLFVRERFRVPVRDISDMGVVSKRNLDGEASLRDLLGDISRPNSPPECIFTKPDPICRFV